MRAGGWVTGLSHLDLHCHLCSRPHTVKEIPARPQGLLSRQKHGATGLLSCPVAAQRGGALGSAAVQTPGKASSVCGKGDCLPGR